MAILLHGRRPGALVLLLLLVLAGTARPQEEGGDPPAREPEAGAEAAGEEDEAGGEAPAVDQEAAEDGDSDPEEEDGTTGDGEEEDVPVVAESERVQRLEDDLEDDRAALSDLEESIRDREAFYEELREGDARLSAELEALEALGEAADQGAVDALRQRLERFATQRELTLASVKAMRAQRDALQLKIDQGEAARATLLGLEPEDAGAPAATPGAGAPPPTTAAPGGLPLPVPGLPSGEAARAPEPEGQRLQTAEQIEAEQEAVKAESRAAAAERAVLDFLERKDTLEEQISLEEQLLETARGSRDNFDGALKEREAMLKDLLDEGVSGARLDETRDGVRAIRELAEEARVEVDTRQERLTALRKRLSDLKDEQLTVTREAERLREESRWLQSPLHPRNVLEWAEERGPRILLVLMAAVLALVLIRLCLGRVARAVIRTSRGDREGAGNRAHTLASSFRSASTVIIVMAAFFLVLEQAGIDIVTVLGGAAILGVAVAFGAQNLMRDYFTGFLILLEDQFEIGDLVTIGDITGRVERVNMRTTMLRDLEGRMHFIPNGEIKAVTNRTFLWGRAVIEVPVGFDEDVERVMDVCLDVCRELAADPGFSEWIIDEPEMLGVDKFTEAGVHIKFMVRTVPDRMFPVRREALRRLKNRFDREGIRITAPHRIVVAPPGTDGDAPG